MRRTFVQYKLEKMKEKHEILKVLSKLALASH